MKHKYFFLLAIFWFFSAPLFAQQFVNDSVKLFVDKSVELIKTHSINRENIDVIREDLYRKSANLSSVDQVAPLFAGVFKQLQDYHGNLKYKGKTYGWEKSTDLDNKYLKERLKDGKRVHSEVINKNIAYLRIPGNNDFRSKKIDSIADDIVKHINAVNTKHIKGWIIDLRLNTGGNMYPILLGLKEFIGDNLVFGGFENTHNQPTGTWEVKEGKMIIDGVTLDRKTVLEHTIKSDIPMVILTSCYTASAGEMTAIALIGRKNTTIIGEPTANYTTAVQGFLIDDQAGINLSTDYVVDRNHKIYKGNITPDVEVLGGDQLEDLKNDRKILEALSFIK